MAGTKKIPGGITVREFQQIAGHLKQILTELDKWGAMRAVSRLNNSNSPTAAPHFVGIVEASVLEAARVSKNDPDPGLYRFADDNYSRVYNDTVNDGAGGMQKRNWKDDYNEKSTHAKALGPESGCNYQRFIAIRSAKDGKNQHVGTITVSFKDDPARHDADVEKTLKKWAQDAQNSALLKFLTAEFELNGPTF